MKRWLFFLVMAVTLCGCLTQAPRESGRFNAHVPDAEPGMPPPAEPTESGAPGGARPQPIAAEASNRLVIQNVWVTLVVSDVEQKMDAIAELAETMGGFVVNSELHKIGIPGGQEVHQGEITIRVPSKDLNDALNRIKQDAIEVRDEQRRGQDITQEFVDLQARLRSLEATEKQLVEIMDKAQKTDEVMNAFNQLINIREQIEKVKGQIQYHQEASALSAIRIILLAKETIKPLEIGGWSPKGVARDSLQNLIYFLQGFINFLIRFFLYYLWVLLLAVALPLWILWHIGWFIWSRWRRKRLKVQTASE